MDESAKLTPAQVKALAVVAWHDAKTDADKSAAVKEYPVLKEIYSEASNF